MPFKAGRIVLVAYPFTDHTTAKLRPALIVSSCDQNRGNDFIAVPISSRIDANDRWGYVILENESYFSNTGLRCSSSIKWTKPMTINSSVVKRRLGVLPTSVLCNICAKIKSLFGNDR